MAVERRDTLTGRPAMPVEFARGKAVIVYDWQRLIGAALRYRYRAPWAIELVRSKVGRG